jgi:hypothetical protein
MAFTRPLPLPPLMLQLYFPQLLPRVLSAPRDAPTLDLNPPAAPVSSIVSGCTRIGQSQSKTPSRLIFADLPRDSQWLAGCCAGVVNPAALRYAHGLNRVAGESVEE